MHINYLIYLVPHLIFIGFKPFVFWFCTVYFLVLFRLFFGSIPFILGFYTVYFGVLFRLFLGSVPSLYWFYTKSAAKLVIIFELRKYFGKKM